MSGKIDLDELLELESKAIPGPWKAFGETDSPRGKFFSGVKTLATVPYDEDVISPYVKYESAGSSESEFIAAMRNNIRPLLLELKAAREVVESVKSLFVESRLDPIESLLLVPEWVHDELNHVRKKYDEVIKELEGGEK